jgi:hypothetical protein
VVDSQAGWTAVMEFAVGAVFFIAAFALFWPWNRWRDTDGVESATSLLRTDSVNPALSIPIEDPRVADDSADQSV